MARYALIGPDEVIVREINEKRLDKSAGVRAGYRWVPIVNEKIENNTPGNTNIKSSSTETIELNKVHRVCTIEDKTPAEVLADKAVIVDQLSSQDRDLIIWLGLFVKDLTAQQFSLINMVRTNNGQNPITLAQFARSLSSKANKDLITNQEFKNEVLARGD